MQTQRKTAIASFDSLRVVLTILICLHCNRPAYGFDDSLGLLSSEVHGTTPATNDQSSDSKKDRPARHSCRHGNDPYSCYLCRATPVAFGAGLGASGYALSRANQPRPNEWVYAGLDRYALEQSAMEWSGDPKETMPDDLGYETQQQSEFNRKATYEELQERLGVDGWVRFPAYPYQLGTNGYLLGSRSEFERLGLPSFKQYMGLRLSSEYGTTFNRTELIRSKLLFDTSSRFGIDTDAVWLQQTSSDHSIHSLWLGDVNATFRIADSQSFQFRFGAGVNYLSDANGNDFGVNTTLGLDLYPKRPWILSSEIDIGSLGKTDLFHFRTTAGVTVRRFEPFIGFDYYDIGRFQMRSMVAGLRIWF